MARFLDSWLICGPFFSDRGWATLDEDYLFGEAHVRPRAGMLSFGREWAPFDTADGFLQFLNAPFQHTLFCTAYAHTYVHSPGELEAWLLVGSDDGIAVWLNGEEVWRHDVNRACIPGEDTAGLRLRSGWNSLLVKVRQGMAHWQFCAQLAHQRGGGIEGLRWQRDSDDDPPPTAEKSVGVRVRFDSETYTARGGDVFRSVQFEFGATGAQAAEDAVIFSGGSEIVCAGEIPPGQTRLVQAEIPFRSAAALMRGEYEVRIAGGQPDEAQVRLSEPSRLLRDLFAPVFVANGESAVLPEALGGFAVARFAGKSGGEYLMPDPPGLREHLGGIAGRSPMKPEAAARARADCARMLELALQGDVPGFEKALTSAELPPREEN